MQGDSHTWVLVLAAGERIAGGAAWSFGYVHVRIPVGAGKTRMGGNGTRCRPRTDR